MRKVFVLKKETYNRKYKLCYAKPFEALYIAITGSAEEQFYNSSYKNIENMAEILFSELTPLECKILVYRFGFLGKWHTLQQVGDILNLSRERIRQIEAKALRKLRHPSKMRQFVSRYPSYGCIVEKNEEITNAKEMIISGIKNHLFDGRNKNEIFEKVLEKNNIGIHIKHNGEVHNVDDVELSYRVWMCLRREGVKTLEELTYRTLDDMMKIRNLGRKSLNELLELMSSFGLFLLDDDFSEKKEDGESKKFVTIEVLFDDELKTYKLINPSKDDVVDCVYDTLCNDVKYSHLIYNYNISVGLWNLLLLKGYIYAENLIEDVEILKNELSLGGFDMYIQELQDYVSQMKILINDEKKPTVSFFVVDNNVAKQMVRKKVSSYSEMIECCNTSDEEVNKETREHFDKKCRGCQIDIDTSEELVYEQYQKYIDVEICEADLKEVELAEDVDEVSDSVKISDKDEKDNGDVDDILKARLENLDVDKLIIEKIMGSTRCELIIHLWGLSANELCFQVGLNKNELEEVLNEMEKIASTVETKNKRLMGHIERCRNRLLRL